MSTTLVRSNLPGRYVASLTMDKLYPLDSGIFTCEAFDWHSRVNSSYELKVFTKPQVKVYPLSATVYSAQPYTVSCFSLDYDPLIGYNWLKNGEILNPLYDDELIEDLYPAGIRLIVPKALTRAVYTCLVTTPLGTVGKESMLTVIPSNISSEFIQTCPKETHEDIDWPETAIDGIAVEPCPPGYKVNEPYTRLSFGFPFFINESTERFAEWSSIETLSRSLHHSPFGIPYGSAQVNNGFNGNS
ncbi:protein sidekick-like [Tetranychus urticae]|uniref:protein sidekick-like n=1 Tax=Tetranychus urticae TaxID=32264 RepID=UPI00077BFDC2|nr:protein sidekick-like [Tetranychus urticae]